jgi:hypothetical protein
MVADLRFGMKRSHLAAFFVSDLCEAAMEHEQRCDVALFHVWPMKMEPVRSGGETSPLIEQKMALRDEALRRQDVTQLLNDMTIELKAHFQFFKLLRERAGEGGEEGEETDGKQLRTDMKAASDALSLIVRTLEKIDELQRQMAKEHDLALEEEASSDDYEKAVAFFLERIESLAEEKFQQRLRQSSSDV